jgi:SP family general alpha glucoside:H+ symporter-like MFS transporter
MEKKLDAESKPQILEQEYAATYDDNAKVSDFKAGAIEAENAEHAMGVLQAVKAYPMATFWAFVMWVDWFWVEDYA